MVYDPRRCFTSFHTRKLPIAHFGFRPRTLANFTDTHSSCVSLTHLLQETRSLGLSFSGAGPGDFRR